MVDPSVTTCSSSTRDRDEPEDSDFTSFAGEITQGGVLSKSEWRVEEVGAAHDLPNPGLVSVPA